MKIKLIIGLSLISTYLFALTPYEEFKAGIKKEKELPQEILDYREYKIQIINRRSNIPAFKSKEKQEKIAEIKKCVNTKETIEDIENCVPSILKG